MNPFDPLRKLLHADEAVALYGGQSGTVFTDGLFDILHRGHVAFLAEARGLGDRLIVGIPSDTAIHPPDRPLHSDGERAFQLAALESVDAVVVYGEPTPIALLARLRPSVYVQGGDQDPSGLAQTALVRSWGGRALFLPFIDEFSTISFVERIRGQAANLGSLR